MIDQVQEELLHIVSSFSTDLEIGQTQRGSFFLALIFLDLSIFQIDFVANQEDEAIVVFILVEEGDPHFCFFKAGGGCDIVDDKGAVGIFEVAGNE